MLVPGHRPGELQELAIHKRDRVGLRARAPDQRRDFRLAVIAAEKLARGRIPRDSHRLSRSRSDPEWKRQAGRLNFRSEGDESSFTARHP